MQIKNRASKLSDLQFISTDLILQRVSEPHFRTSAKVPCMLACGGKASSCARPPSTEGCSGGAGGGRASASGTCHRSWVVNLDHRNIQVTLSGKEYAKTPSVQGRDTCATMLVETIRTSWRDPKTGDGSCAASWYTCISRQMLDSARDTRQCSGGGNTGVPRRREKSAQTDLLQCCESLVEVQGPCPLGNL